MKIVYISGQITGLFESKVKLNFELARHHVIYHEHADVVYNPLEIKPFLNIKKWLFYMINDLRKQRKCTHSAFQRNWINSKGSVIEYFFAKFIFKHEIIFL